MLKINREYKPFDGKYKVELKNGHIMHVPNDKAKTVYENISKYGLQAVLERVARTRYAKKLAEELGCDAKYVVKTIICRDGEEVTQF